MATALRIGKIGPFYVSLSYTWLFVSVLGLWWVALLWLPENFPGRGSRFNWSVAVAVMGLFLLSVLAREWLRAAATGIIRPSITLYPFGASTPYRSEYIGSPRLVLSSLAAIFFSLMLGGALLWLSGLPGVPDAARALMIPLGWLNLAVGVLNLIPGMPFDGGRLLGAVVFWFNGERETSIGAARSMGEMAALLIVLVGAWRGLTTQSWLESLALVVIGWAAREAERSGRERAALRAALNTVRVREVMEQTRQDDAVQANSTVADMVLSHPHYQPDLPLAVVDDQHNTVGVVTLSQADNLLQGTWPSTRVSTLMAAPGGVRSVHPEESLTNLVEMMEQSPATLVDQPSILVMEDGALVGSVDPSRLEAFERIDLELGAEEALGEMKASAGLMSRLRPLIPAVMVLAAMGVIGNIVLNTDPDYLNSARIPPGQAAVVFREVTPEDGSVVGPQNLTIRAEMVGAQPITTVSISLDDKPMETVMAVQSPQLVVATVKLFELSEGTHTVTLIAVTRGGYMERKQWSFVASSASMRPLSIELKP